MDKIDEVIKILGLEWVQRLPFVVTLHEKSKLPANLLVAIGVLIASILCLSVAFGSMFTTLLMFLLPAYDTFKAIESKNQEEQTRLLTYWMVFGTIFALDNTFRWIFCFIPMYHLIRFAILSALYSKQIKGAEVIYTFVQKPFFDKYESCINSLIEPVEDSLANLGEKFTKKE